MYICTMSKAVNKPKKSAKQSSVIFHNIMGASVANNPKPKNKQEVTKNKKGA